MQCTDGLRFAFLVFVLTLRLFRGFFRQLRVIEEDVDDSIAPQGEKEIEDPCYRRSSVGLPEHMERINDAGLRTFRHYRCQCLQHDNNGNNYENIREGDEEDPFQFSAEINLAETGQDK